MRSRSRHAAGARNSLTTSDEGNNKLAPMGLCPVPDEPTPAGGGSGAGRAFSVQRYGMFRWGDLFTARQKVALTTLSRMIRARSSSDSPLVLLTGLLSMSLGKTADLCNALAPWKNDAECPVNLLGSVSQKTHN